MEQSEQVSFRQPSQFITRDVFVTDDRSTGINSIVATWLVAAPIEFVAMTI